MFWDIIFWGSIIYIGFFILVKLDFAIELFRDGYKNAGLMIAVKMFFSGFLMKIRGLAKLRLIISFIALVVSSYYGNNYLGLSKPYFDTDIENLLYYFESYETNNTNDYNQELEKFSNRINQYSNTGIRKLKIFSKIYISHANSCQIDYYNSLNSYSPGKEITFQISTDTKKLRDGLLKYDIKKNIDLGDKNIRTLFQKINNELRHQTEQEKLSFIEIGKQRAKENQSRSKSLMESVYKIIFKDNYTE